MTIRLKGAKLRALFESVIERDEVCQNPFCASGWPLDIPHHVKKKSQSGSDVAENLVLLCCECHRKIHHEGRLKVTGVYPNFKFKEVGK